MRHLVITVISSLILCRLSATHEAATQYHIIDDSEDFIPYDNYSYHPILQAHLEGPEDNLQSSISQSEPQEESTQREAVAAVEIPLETPNDQGQLLETPTIESEPTLDPESSKVSNPIGERDQLLAPDVPAPAQPEQFEEQPSPEKPSSEQPSAEHKSPDQPSPDQTPLEKPYVELTPPEQLSEQALPEQESSEQPPVSNGKNEEILPPEVKVSQVEENIAGQATPDQQSVKVDEEPTPIQSKVDPPSRIVAPERADENESLLNTSAPKYDEPLPTTDVPQAAASGDTQPQPAEPAASVVTEVKPERLAQIKPGRIPMKESSHQHSSSTPNLDDSVKPKSSMYEEEEDDYQFSMFSDVTPKMAIFSGLTIMSLIGGMIYQLVLKNSNEPLVQPANTTNVTKSTNHVPPPAQNLKDKEIVFLEKKIKLLERKLQLAPLQTTLKELKSKNIDSRLSESKSFLNQIRQYQIKLEENRTLKGKVVADRYERLLQIRNLQDINKIPGVIRYIDYHKRVENREMNICEMQAEDEFLREQIDLFRELVSEFEREYSSLNEEINRVKAEGLNLEKERSNIAVN